MTLKFIRKQFKLLHSESMLRPFSLRAKQTIQITYIRYFKIAPGNHRT